MKKYFLMALALVPMLSLAQDEDLLADIDIEETPSKVSSAFKSMKIINFESTKIAAKGDLYFVASHRFNDVTNGIYDWFGLDGASVNLRFIYGINDWLSVSVDRSSTRKTYQGNIKYRLISQTDSFPLTVVGYNGIAYMGLRNNDPSLLKTSSHKVSYVNQLLISSKLSKTITLELMPTHFHQNFVEFDDQQNSQFVLGVGGRYKLSSRVALTAEYGRHFNRSVSSEAAYNNPAAIGVDVETGGHVFQLHFTNARYMDEVGYLANAAGDWTKGEVSFGFNMVRVF